MLNRFGQLLAEAMYEAGIGSYSKLLEHLLDAGADPEEANVNTLVTAMTSTRVHTRPTFSQDFWRVLVSPDVLDLTEDESKALMHAYVMSEVARTHERV